MKAREILNRRKPYQEGIHRRKGDEIKELREDVETLQANYNRLLNIVIELAGTSPKMMKILHTELDRDLL